MLISRSLPLIRSALLRSSKTSSILKVPKRNSGGEGLAYEGWRYRNTGQEPGCEANERATDYAFIFFWWWVCYHCITKYDHLIGEYPWPDASKWTDEELGVPPDDYEPPNRA